MDETVSSRFIIGIDLGTTNCSLCYVDQAEAPDAIRVFDIPQLVAAGEIGRLPLLPSFAYLPGAHELPDGALALPWNGDCTCAVGQFAREQGARVPERLISSAKSWLAHAGVDRTHPILPWDSDLGAQRRSPVQASEMYLAHLRDSWNHVMGHRKDRDGTPCLLQEQNVVLTVPASFDEAARDLTLKAARKAGFRHVTLIEEPLAAFYAWLYRHRADWQENVSAGDVILVVDVGGGTSDFSLVEMDAHGVLSRKAVGNHLLLGGDNMDMALARMAENGWKAHLKERQWAMLCQECRRVKELLMADDGVNAAESAAVSLPGLGSSVVASSRSYVFSRRDVQDVILGQFFGELPVDAPEPTRRKGFQCMGLPYAADPMITRHLLQFLRDAGRSLSVPSALARPTKVLFNGGAMKSQLLRDHVRHILETWSGQAVQELVSEDFSLAVSIGAADYSLARAGQAPRVKGGIANAYFLEIQSEDGRKLLCVMPRDTDEGVVCRQQRSFRLQANTLVSFPLYASATRLGDKTGDVIGTDTEDVLALPPLNTMLKYGGGADAAELEVTIASRLSAIGTLEIWCEALRSDHRFPLTFGVRDSAEPSCGTVAVPANAIVIDNALEQKALAMIAAAFEDPCAAALEPLMKNLEAALELARSGWPAQVLRRLADMLLEHPGWRSADARHESRWENLLGFCMRPGLGVVGDDQRIRRAWMLWHKGPEHPSSPEVMINWLVLWRRLAAGLSSGQQNQMSGVLFRELVTKDMRTTVRKDDSVALEKWRLVASLEKLPVNFKLRCLTALLNGTGRLDDAGFWLMARLASRRLFAGMADSVIPASRLELLMTPMMQKARQANTPRNAMLALANAARQTGERSLDLNCAVRNAVADFLKAAGASAELLAPIENLQEQERDCWQPELLGDSLPLGISI